MIIGQGQLDTVLNARPEDRRAIIEEAAGVLKHRRRRERAERRLAATAENLERLGDLVREVRRQIRPLERQAAAARSHDSVAIRAAGRAALPGRGRAGRPDRPAAATAAQHLAVCRRRGARAPRRRSSGLTPRPTSTTAELSSRREEDLASALGGCRAWWSGPAGRRASSASGAGRSWPRSTPPPTSTSSPPSRPRPPGWPARWCGAAEEEAGGAPERAELEARWPPSTTRCAALRDPLGVRAGRRHTRTRPSPGPGPAASCSAAPRRASSRTWPRSGQPRRLARATHGRRRRAGRPARQARLGRVGRPTAGAGRRAGRAHQRTRGRPPPTPKPAQAAVRRGRTGAPPHRGARRGPRAGAARPAGRRRPRAAARSRRRRRAPCSTWWRSTRAGRPPSRPPPAPVWPPSWSTDAIRPRPPWPRCASAG